MDTPDKTAATYSRVSTRVQKEQGTSLETQSDATRAYAEQHGYSILAQIQDDMTGTTLDRPGLARVRQLVAARAVNTVIAYDPDRLSRSLPDLLLLDAEFAHYGVALEFVTMEKDGSPNGKMYFAVKAVFAEHERNVILERTQRGKRKRAEEGRVLGGRVHPFGYKYVKGEHRYEVIEAEAEWVVRIFTWVAKEHCSLNEVARRLNSFAVPTKQGAPFWSSTALRYILRNPVYKGEWHWNKTQAITPKAPRNSERKCRKSSRVKRGADQVIVVPVDPIVTSELFDAVQRQLDRNRLAENELCKGDYLLRALVVCSVCGSHMRDHKTRNYLYYECLGRDNRRNPEIPACSSKPVNAEKLDGLVWQEVASFISDPDRIRLTIEGRGEYWQREQKNDEERLQMLTELIRKGEVERKRWCDAYRSGAIQLDLFQADLQLLNKRNEALEAEKLAVEERMQSRGMAEAKTETIERFCRLIHAGIDRFSDEDKRRTLLLLGLTIRTDGDEIAINGLIGNELVKEVGRAAGELGGEEKSQPPRPRAGGSGYTSSPANSTPRRLSRR